MARQRVSPAELVIRCYAEKKDGVWLAFCVDLSLGAQGDSFDEVKRKLEAQIVEFVEDACGQDRPHAAAMFKRKAPLRFRIRYWWLALKLRWHTPKQPLPNRARSFKEALPLRPAHCGA